MNDKLETIHAVESIHIATDLPIRWGVEFSGRVLGDR